METVNKDVKTLLAKLLATEDINDSLNEKTLSLVKAIPRDIRIKKIVA